MIKSDLPMLLELKKLYGIHRICEIRQDTGHGWNLPKLLLATTSFSISH